MRVTVTDVGFAIDVSARCRDCGAEMPSPLDLRGRVHDAVADREPDALVNVDAPGACGACGGGRIAVRTTFRVEP